MRSLLALILLPLCSAHMAITVIKDGASHECRSNPIVGDRRRNPNESRCHGVGFSADNDLFVLAAGETVVSKTTFGAGHNGGHSVWALSTDGETFYKFQDDVDATLTGGQEHEVTLPTSAPAECAAGGVSETEGYFLRELCF